MRAGPDVLCATLVAIGRASCQEMDAGRRPEQESASVRVAGLKAGTPGRWERASFFMRSNCLKAWRALRDLPHPLRGLRVGPLAEFPFIVGESISRLRTDSNPLEAPLLLGKLENLRLGCRAMNLRVVAAGQVFSFWRQVGPPWRVRGFAIGREVREGCIVPTIGGGLCQLSGSLLEAARQAGLEVLECHAHTALPADIGQRAERDATVFWNYVDLRLRAEETVLIEAFLTAEELILRIRSKAPGTRQRGLTVLSPPNALGRGRATFVSSCYSCGKTGCAQHHVPEFSGPVGRTAFLVNEFQPEFGDLIERESSELVRSRILAPKLGARGEAGWRRVEGLEGTDFPAYRLERSWILRRTVRQGKALAAGHLEAAERLARRFAGALSHEVENLFIAQSLLPFLWRDGILGGRSFCVLMERLPVQLLERELDQAAERYPQSSTLGDFRAPPWYAEAESEALEAASALYTPHAHIARMTGQKTARLNWMRPGAVTCESGGAVRDLVVFPGPALGRKGAYAVREAMRGSRLRLGVVGRDLEGAGFWGDLAVERLAWGDVPWSRVVCVAQPALVENWPRRLLEARARGCGLVVSGECGLDSERDRGVIEVPFGDGEAVRRAVEGLATRAGDA